MDSQLTPTAGAYHLPSSSSPLGDLHEPATKQLLVSLITTMNASFPDYDFRSTHTERARGGQACNQVFARRQACTSPRHFLILAVGVVSRACCRLLFPSSGLRAEQFQREASPQAAMNAINVRARSMPLSRSLRRMPNPR